MEYLIIVGGHKLKNKAFWIVEPFRLKAVGARHTPVLRKDPNMGPMAKWSTKEHKVGLKHAVHGMFDCCGWSQH